MVNGYAAAADRPPLDLHAVAMATNMHAITRGPKVSSNCGVTRVVTQISEDQSIAVIAGVNLGQGSGARTAIKVLRQLVEFRDAKDARRKATITADHRSRAIPAATDTWAINTG